MPAWISHPSIQSSHLPQSMLHSMLINTFLFPLHMYNEILLHRDPLFRDEIS